MAESLRMSLSWAGHMREGNGMHEKMYGLGKGFNLGSKKRDL
jgi:hypothetical protein